MNKAHFLKLCSPLLLIVGFLQFTTADAMPYVCKPNTPYTSVSGGSGCSQFMPVPAEYLTLESVVLMCNFPDPTAMQFFTSHSTGTSWCSNSLYAEWHKLSDQSPTLGVQDTDRRIYTIYPTQIGAWLTTGGSGGSGGGTGSTFDFATYLSSGTAKDFFAAGLVLVGMSLVVGHAIRSILSMLD